MTTRKRTFFAASLCIYLKNYFAKEIKQLSIFKTYILVQTDRHTDKVINRGALLLNIATFIHNNNSNLRRKQDRSTQNPLKNVKTVNINAQFKYSLCQNVYIFIQNVNCFPFDVWEHLASVQPQLMLRKLRKVYLGNPNQIFGIFREKSTGLSFAQFRTAISKFQAIFFPKCPNSECL